MVCLWFVLFAVVCQDMIFCWYECGLLGLWSHFVLLVQDSVCWYTLGVYDGDRSERVALRVSLVEKELWVEAAGGSRRLSDWIRDRLNAVVAGGVGGGCLGGVADAGHVFGGLSSPVTAGSLVDGCSRAVFHGGGGTCAECGVAFPFVRREVKPDFKPGMRI